MICGMWCLLLFFMYGMMNWIGIVHRDARGKRAWFIEYQLISLAL